MIDPRNSSVRHRRVVRVGERSSEREKCVTSSANEQAREAVLLGPAISEPGLCDETMNIMKARHRETDSLLEVLHKTLREQTVAARATAQPSLDGSSLSGAVISGAVPRRDVSRKHLRIEPMNANRPKHVGLSNSLSRTERLISLAGGLGMDMSTAFNDISRAKAALGKDRLVIAKRWQENANKHALAAISKGFPVLVKRTSASLGHLEAERGAEHDIRELLSRSKQAMKRGSRARALLLMSDARNRLQIAQEDTVLKIIHDAKGDFIKARQARIHIGDAVVLLNRSRDNLRAGKFTEAVSCARESGKRVKKSLESHRNARNPLVESIRAIRLAESLGADTKDLNMMLAEARQLFMRNELERSAECSRKLLAISRQTAYDKAAESYQMAEKALTLAKKTVGEAPESEEKLRKAREHLEKYELAKSFSMSCASVFESDSAIANALMDRLRGIDEFAKGIENDVDSLSEVREAIETSKERNLENLRKYATLTESIVGEAYECAAAYSRVAQDIVKQAYENSVQLSPPDEMTGASAIRPEIPSHLSSSDIRPSDEKRQRLIELFLTGKVSEDQLDKLLLMVDASIQKDSLI